MKKFIFCLILAVIGLTSTAEIKREGNTFKIEQACKTNEIQTKYTWQDKEGKTYPIYITKKGTCYIYRISKKTGKKYRYYIPKNIQKAIQKELGYE